MATSQTAPKRGGDRRPDPGLPRCCGSVLGPADLTWAPLPTVSGRLAGHGAALEAGAAGPPPLVFRPKLLGSAVVPGTAGRELSEGDAVDATARCPHCIFLGTVGDSRGHLGQSSGALGSLPPAEGQPPSINQPVGAFVRMSPARWMNRSRAPRRRNDAEGGTPPATPGSCYGAFLLLRKVLRGENPILPSDELLVKATQSLRRKRSNGRVTGDGRQPRMLEGRLLGRPAGSRWDTLQRAVPEPTDEP